MDQNQKVANVKEVTIMIQEVEEILEDEEVLEEEIITKIEEEDKYYASN